MNGYNYKTGKYEFDFDSVDFPIVFSDNVMHYLYPSSRNLESYEYIKSILNGEDRSQSVCKFLTSLFARKPLMSGEKGEFVNMPPADFDILSDQVTKTETKEFILKHWKGETKPTYSVETHEGECVLGDLKFRFVYELEIRPNVFSHLPRVKNVNSFIRGDAKVVLEGDDFINEDSMMFIACRTYLEKKNAIIQAEIDRIERKKEEEIWIEFRSKIRQELIEWLSGVIQNELFNHVCPRVKWEVTSGHPSYRLVKTLAKGYCLGCTGNCRFTEKALHTPYQQLSSIKHSQKWFELGLDKLDFKHLK